MALSVTLSATLVGDHPAPHREDPLPHTPTPCPGRCNHRWREAEAASRPHDYTPTWGNPNHCLSCTSHAYRHLAELPELLAAVWLEAIHGTRTPADATTTRPSGLAPWPGQAARLLTDHIVYGMAELEDDIRELRHLSTRPNRGREGATATGTIDFLATHLDWALDHHPAATEIHDRDSANPASQIHYWHRAALRFTKRDEQHEAQRLAPCPRCHGPYLITSPKDGLIECRDPDCQRVLTEAEYEDYVKRLRGAIQAAA